MSKFVVAWDGLRGSNSHCTTLLRDAIIELQTAAAVADVDIDVPSDAAMLTDERELVGV